VARSRCGAAMTTVLVPCASPRRAFGPSISGTKRRGAADAKTQRTRAAHIQPNNSTSPPGFRRIATTAIYMHLTEPTRASLKGILDKLMTGL
jgi:hypothetical protein